MNEEIKALNPKIIWSNFYQITQIPHPSGSEKAIIDWVEQQANQLGLSSLRDTAGNIVVRKPATAGFENWQPIILQCHADMVPQKEPDSQHDFATQPIEAYVDGNIVRARGTTLGADNGIGLAAAMSILSDPEAQHGPLEVLVTVEEETCMGGAFALQPSVLQGKTLLNLDSEQEGEVSIGCAGGLNAVAKFELNTVATADEDAAFLVKMTGLRGGHSGIDINLGRANAIKLLTRFLKFAAANYEAMLSDIDGGDKHNAIPREAWAVVTIDSEEREAFLEDVEEYAEIFRNEYQLTDPELSFTATEVKRPKKVFDEMTADDLINALQGCPNGVLRMMGEKNDMVETSVNLASVKREKKDIVVTFLIRSACDTQKENVASQIDSIFSMAGARIELTGDYPGWQPDYNSAILSTFRKEYAATIGGEPRVISIHAGLECGIFAGKTEWDMISFGPTIRHPHSPAEYVEIDTVERFYQLLKNILIKA